MTEYTLKRSEEKTLRVNIGDKSFTLPLQGSLTFKEATLLATPEGTYSFMKKYVPKEIMEDLKIEEYNQILSVYRKESEKQAGKSLGES